MRALVAFLGRQRREKGGYPEAAYRFGEDVIKARYFADALRRREKFDRIVILGTSGSMWDVFLDNEGVELDEDDALRLIEACDACAVSEEDLRPLQQALGACWQCDVRLHLLGDGRTHDGQIELLRTLVEAVQDAKSVVFDITHGYRLFPMFALAAALFLEMLYAVKVEALYYGMFEAKAKDGSAPAVRLDGLQQALQWGLCLVRYDAGGDLAALAELAPEDAPAVRGVLRQIGFLEKTSQIVAAWRSVKTNKRQLNAMRRHPLGAWLLPLIEERLAWGDEPTVAAAERRLAYAYLERGDWVRAAAMFHEACLTHQAEQMGLDPYAYESRECAKRELRADPIFQKLANMRNALVHGRWEQELGGDRSWRDEQTMISTLKSLFVQMEKKLGWSEETGGGDR